MTRITPDHLARGAFIYVRQSTNDQVLHNHESRRRQYGLVDRARELAERVNDCETAGLVI
jgi:DNA invertase Pin-like site-specific DNA recombinase